MQYVEQIKSELYRVVPPSGKTTIEVERRQDGSVERLRPKEEARVIPDEFCADIPSHIVRWVVSNITHTKPQIGNPSTLSMQETLDLVFWEAQRFISKKIEKQYKKYKISTPYKQINQLRPTGDQILEAMLRLSTFVVENPYKTDQIVASIDAIHKKFARRS